MLRKIVFSVVQYERGGAIASVFDGLFVWRRAMPLRRRFSRALSRAWCFTKRLGAAWFGGASRRCQLAILLTTATAIRIINVAIVYFRMYAVW